MKRRKHLLLLCVVTVVVGLVAACGPAPTPEIIKETVVVVQTVEVVVEPTPVPQSLTILTTADYQSFDPNTKTSQVTGNMRQQVIEQLQKRGFKSPYLRNYVVARINPVRFHRAKKGDATPPMPIPAALTRMAASAGKFDLASVKPGDLALVAAVTGDDE